ncbi:unnamed protein product [Heligmosomoides polygyrus]|uniref:Uncharacterized protein n=1 Tax=Heligmosomoides polygyrus TaxID=6339 RepID=A0A183F527_HELPZ|nr:unnamed protein product [Heligmosomoides polygyrus]
MDDRWVNDEEHVSGIAGWNFLHVNAKRSVSQTSYAVLQSPGFLHCDHFNLIRSAVSRRACESAFEESVLASQVQSLEHALWGVVLVPARSRISDVLCNLRFLRLSLVVILSDVEDGIV